MSGIRKAITKAIADSEKRARIPTKDEVDALTRRTNRARDYRDTLFKSAGISAALATGLAAYGVSGKRKKK